MASVTQLNPLPTHPTTDKESQVVDHTAQEIHDATTQLARIRAGSLLVLEKMCGEDSDRQVDHRKINTLLRHTWYLAAKTDQDLRKLSEDLEALQKPQRYNYAERRGQAIAEDDAERRGERQRAATELAAVQSRVAAATGLEVFLTCGSQPVASGGPSAPEGADGLTMACEGVFTAIVTLGAPGMPVPLRVLVVSPDEYRQKSRLGLSHSSSLVFRRVSSLAVRALDYFRQHAASERQLAASVPPQSDSWQTEARVLENLLLWLSTFRDLFTRRCSLTDTLLAAEPATRLLLPPLMRTYKLSHRRLLENARREKPWNAYHISVAPFPLF
eukprot:jgi/Botrbrau1/23163/Bobra.0041s0014.1